MKPFHLFCRIIIPVFVSGMFSALAQSGNGLLLPFPADAVVESPPAAVDQGVPGRSEPAPDNRHEADARRAAELADTFIRRQLSEVTNSVPRRGDAPAARIPTRIAAPRPVIAFQATAPALDSSGPVSELLPLPGENVAGDFTGTGMPEENIPLLDNESPPPAAEPSPHEVPRTDLAPAPAYGGVEVQARSGPVFRVGGTEAFKVARSRGFRFTPAGGIGARDGVHTAASQFPHTLTSEVHGTRMAQFNPPPAWSVTETSNTFFMFCDASYNAVRLAPGWRIRGIKLKGPAWRWVACPRSGSNTTSFSIRVHSYKGQETATAVALEGLTLEGPEGATDWKDAFPWINGKGPANAPQSAPPQLETPPAQSFAAVPAPVRARATGEPPLPQ